MDINRARDMQRVPGNGGTEEAVRRKRCRALWGEKYRASGSEQQRGRVADMVLRAGASTRGTQFLE